MDASTNQTAPKRRLPVPAQKKISHVSGKKARTKGYELNSIDDNRNDDVRRVAAAGRRRANGRICSRYGIHCCFIHLSCRRARLLHIVEHERAFRADGSIRGRSAYHFVGEGADDRRVIAAQTCKALPGGWIRIGSLKMVIRIGSYASMRRRLAGVYGNSVVVGRQRIAL